MELRQLSAVVGIADHGSFSAAADALQTVQSNISAHVKKLERELGCELVDRSTGQLTEAGALVVAQNSPNGAAAVLRQYDSVVLRNLLRMAIDPYIKWAIPE